MARNEFTTFYFEPGFESLVNVAQYVELMSGVDVGIGSDFINVYTETPNTVAFCREVIEAYTLDYPHVRLSEREHGRPVAIPLNNFNRST